MKRDEHSCSEDDAEDGDTEDENTEVDEDGEEMQKQKSRILPTKKVPSLAPPHDLVLACAHRYN